MYLRTIRACLLTAGTAVVLAACGGASGDPIPDPNPVPSPAPDPSPAPTPGDLEITISPHSGPHQSQVTIRASGFEPGARVGIGIGPPQSEYDIFEHATADSGGGVETTVRVPDWTEAGSDYLFVAKAPTGEDVISSPFRVTPEDGDERGETVRVRGELTDEGVECPALRDHDGRLYTLTGDLGEFDVGDHVEVEGRVAEMSICMQGTTLEVVRIRAAP